MIYKLPQQMLSTKEKFSVKENEKVPWWFKENRWYFVSRANENIEQKIRIEKLYKIADETLIDTDYSRVVNPLKSKKPEYNSMPATLRNYDIIKPIIDRFMGERRKRPNRFEVLPVGVNVTNEIKDKIQSEYKVRLTQRLITYLQAEGLPLTTDTNEEETEQVQEGKQNPQQIAQEEIEEKVVLSYLEDKAINGYHTLEILNQDLRLEDAYQEGFYDFLVCGQVCDFKAIFNNNVEYCIVSPLELEIIGWDETSKFGEDATAAVRTMKWAAASVIDHFGKQLDEDQIKKIKELEANLCDNSSYNSPSSNFFRTSTGEYAEFQNGLLTVEHIVWKTLTKRGILTYQSDIGIEKMPVDDSYILAPEMGDIDIEWTWENEWFEVFSLSPNIFSRLGDDVIFLHWGVGEVQRNMLDNTSSCKLPYNSIKRGYRNNTIVSPVKTGLAFQELINTLHYRFDLALSRSYDKLLLFPIGLIPKIKGWDTERWMYSVRAFSIAFFDETSEKAQTAIQGMKEIDMSLGNYMQAMWGLIQTVKQEYWEAVGFNPQRFGDIGNNSGKGLTEQAIYQSNSSTYDMIAQYEGFREKSLNALLDYSKFAWIDGKKGTYYTSDKQLVCYDIEGINHAGTEYGVFCVNPAQEESKLEFYKQTILQPLAQNGNNPDLIAQIVDTDNFSKVKELAIKARQLNEQFQMQQQKQINDSNERVAGANLEAEQLKTKTALELGHLKADTEIEKALIMADSFNAKEGDTDGDSISESDEIIDRHYERINKMREGMNKQRSENQKVNMQNKKMAMDEKKMQSAERIAKMNKN